MKKLIAATVLVLVIGALPLEHLLMGGPEPRVTLCHVPPGNPVNFHTITVGEAAVNAHLGHGDFPGPCEI